MAEVRVTHRFAAPMERVFDAWTNPEVARRFLFATPDGEMVECNIDAKPRGRYTITERRPSMGEVKHVGEYVQIDRPHRLVFTLAVPQFDPAVSTVSISFVPDGHGCQLTLINMGVVEKYKDSNAQGWKSILETLDRVLAEST